VNDELGGQGIRSVRKIDGEGRILSKASLAAVADDADDLGRDATLALPENDLLSDRILIGKNLLCEMIADDDAAWIRQRRSQLGVKHSPPHRAEPV
jgi:hypothetical protein